jgi:type I restriction enzyme S subunit
LEFPNEWKHFRLGDVATLQRGFDLPVQDRAPGPFPVIGSNGIVGFHNEPKIQGPGVIVGRSGTIGKSFYIVGAYWPLNTGLYVKDFHGNDPLFLHFFFQVFDFGKYGAGVSVPTLNRNLVHEAIVCIPPLPEQHAIAAVLSKIQAAVEVQGKIVATLKELKAATMAKLFREGLRGEPLKQTEIGEIPESWELVQLGSLTTQKITDGTHMTPQYVDEGIPFVTATNLLEDSIDFASCKKISLEEHRQLTKRCKPERDDILLSKVGTLGLVAKVETDAPFSIFVQVALIKVDRTKMNASYLKHVLRSEMLQKRIHNRASRSTMLYIGVGKVAELEIPIPHKEEQQELVTVLDNFDARIANACYRSVTLKSLFSSMLHLLMTGQVRVNHPKIGEVSK